MMAVLRHMSAGLLAALSFAAWPAAADPPKEQALVAPGATPSAAGSRGEWKVKEGKVGPSRRRLVSGAYWLAKGAGARLTDGTVRARFVHGRRLNVTLLVRANLDRHKRRVDSGLAVRVWGRYFWLTRIKGGKLRRLTSVNKLRFATNRASLEVVATLLGKRLVVSVISSPSGQQLGTLATARADVVEGGVGLLSAGRRNDPKSPLVHLSTRKACQDTPAPGDKGPFLTVVIPEAEAAQVKKHAAIRQLDKLDGTPARHVYRTDAVGLERLTCDGRTVLDMSTRLPWKYTDLGYLKLRDAPVQKTDTGFRLDQSVKNPRMVEALLKGYHKRYPKLTRLKKIGKSTQGRPIWALAIGAKKGRAVRPAFLLNAAHHGSEVMSIEFVLDAVQVLLERSSKDPRVKRWLDNVVVWCVPLVNPDGLVAFLDVDRATGRKNGHGLRGIKPQHTRKGVDLNRNYPFRWGASGERASKSTPKHKHYRGPDAASEPETRAMMKLAGRERFAAAISYHTGTVDILAPYTIDGVKNPRPNEAWTVAKGLADKLPAHPQHLDPKTNQPQKTTVRRKLYSVEGTDQDWLRHSFGTLALLVEGAHWTPLDLDKRKEVIAAVRPTWQLLLDRYLDGPSLWGHVRDARGRPVRGAVVAIRQVKLQEKERWTTRPRDGRFDRFLAAPGRYHVEVYASGYRPQTRVVTVKDGERKRLLIVLKKR